MRTFETWIKTKQNSTNLAVAMVAGLLATGGTMAMFRHAHLAPLLGEARAVYEKHCARFARVRAKRK